jgi:hypothetical protein
MCFLMLNPSTADADQDDPTIRRCKGFAKRDGFDGITVVNLFARRAAKPVRLKDPGDPVGPQNDPAILGACRAAEAVVAAWGAHPLARHRGREVVQAIKWGRHDDVWCLGTTKDGSPRHPLLVPAAAELVRWP